MSCFLRGATDLQDIIHTAAAASGVTDVRIVPTACLGQCDGAPAITINEQCYTKVSGQRVADMLYPGRGGDLTTATSVATGGAICL